jgi:hypothetical protein
MAVSNAIVYRNEGLHGGLVNMRSILGPMTVICIPLRVHM